MRTQRRHWRYEPLAACDSPATWFCHSWQFLNRYGIREWGYRVCGWTRSNWNDARVTTTETE